MSDRSTIEKRAVLALKQVIDPELSINIYDLGLIYKIDLDDDKKLHITMTLTTPACPLADQIIEDVHDALSMVPGVSDISIQLTFDPPWGRERMSEEALLELGML